MRKSSKGWKNYNSLQSKRHSNARKFGKAGGVYANSKSASSLKSKMKNNEMKKNVKELSERQKINKFYEDYVIDSISTEGFDGYEGMTLTKKEKLQFAKDRFRSEYWNNNPQAQAMGERKAFESWLQGLALDIDFYNSDIIKLAKKSGSLREDASEKEEDRVIDNYWNYMTNQYYKAFKKYGVE